MNKVFAGKVLWITAGLLPVYAVCSVLHTRSILNLTSAPTWIQYMPLVLECIVIIVLLVLFAAKILGRLPDTGLPGWLKILRIAGLLGIAAAGIFFGIRWGAYYQGASKLPYVLEMVFHTLLYGGLWLLLTESLKLAGKK